MIALVAGLRRIASARLLISLTFALSSGYGRASPPTSPWGVSSSASSFRDHKDWFPKVAAAGVSTVRLFPEWRSIEKTKGVFDWTQVDELLQSAAANRLEITAVLMGSPPGSKHAHAFPMDDLDGWSKFVEAAVIHCRGRIRRWEFWNEGNGGFNDARHTTADYAKLAWTTYEAVRRADPSAKVGLSVASFDALYLHETIRAMAKAGKANSFDYLCVHPYELADGLRNPNGEIPFLWMVKQLRDVLRAVAPERADTEIWVTEVGCRIGGDGGARVDASTAAASLAKIYAMALAQGVACVQWFEARDPIGEDAGFGLLDGSGTPRPSYLALQLLTKHLGPKPRYVGWLTLGIEQRGMGFVFEGKTFEALIAWAPVGIRPISVEFESEVRVLELTSRSSVMLPARRPLSITNTPRLILGPPRRLVETASQNAGKPFPWGGEYSRAKFVSINLGSTDHKLGLFRASAYDLPVVRFPDGSSGVLLKGDIGHPIAFFTHPSYSSVLQREYYVRATIRRIAPGNVGMNLLYQVADSKGRDAYANVGEWFPASNDEGWQSHTWRLRTAGFAKMWGRDVVVRPELSVPFVLGKVEVSTEPFK